MAETTYNADVKTAVDQLMTLPGVKAGKAFGYPAYKAEGKIFAFVGSNGLILKLPTARIEQLVAANPAAKVFEVEPGVFWRQWVIMSHADPAAFAQYQDVIVEAMHFVTGKAAS